MSLYRQSYAEKRKPLGDSHTETNVSSPELIAWNMTNFMWDRVYNTVWYLFQKLQFTANQKKGEGERRGTLNYQQNNDQTGLCLQSCISQWDNQLYKQINGCPMGSPISVVLADLSKQYFEKIMLENSPYEPLFWKRYVDDVITSLPKNQVQNFLQYINSIDENIQFTCEMETNFEIPFLDLLIHNQEDLSWTFSVFRKSMQNKYLSVDSVAESNF